jgi:hypothetical protein
MGYTDKQIRNGATGSGGEQQSAQSGPMPNVAPLQSQAESAGEDRWNEGAGLLATPQGSGPSPGGTRVVGSGGNIWEWDAGLAISEMPGEA